MKHVLPLILLMNVHAAFGASFDTREIEWVDAARNRPVPVKIYLPSPLDQPAPVVIFSHGLGGSREGYSYLGEYWAAHGFVSVHLQHVGSDNSAWKGPAPASQRASMASAISMKEFVDRTADVMFAIDQLTRLNQQPPKGTNADALARPDALVGKLDLSRIAMAGHSYGAQTTQAIAGEVFESPGGDRSFFDRRIKCAIAMSPAPPEQWQKPEHADKTERAFSKTTMPMFYLTGTEDNAPIGPVRAKDRRVPFDLTHAADQYLLTFTGADHMLFAGVPRLLPAKERIEAFGQPLIQQSTTAFLNAYLRNDGSAKTWLRETLKKELGQLGTIEFK